MKKILFGLMALAMMFTFNSCKDTKAPAETTEPTEEVAVEEEATPAAPSMADLIASAKADGATWTADQWKDAFRNVMINAKPMFDDMKEMMALVETDPTKAMEMAQGLEDKYKDLNAQLEEFTTVAEATEIGKQVSNDEEFQKQLEEEFEIPDL